MTNSRKPRTIHIGLLVSNNDRYGREILEGIADYATRFPHWRFRQASPVIESVMRFSQSPLDGVIASIVDERFISPLAGMKCPVLNVSGTFAPSRSRFRLITLDPTACGEVGAAFFHDRGIRRAFGVRFPHLWFARERVKGFQNAFLAKGGSYLGTIDIVNHDPRTLSVLAEHCHEPLGVFGANDALGLMVAQYAMETGMNVPEQLSVLGVGNDPVPCKLAHPSLSSVDAPQRAIGHHAARCLAESLDGTFPKRGPPILLPPLDVVERQSTAVHIVGDSLVSRALHFILEHQNEAITVDELAQAVGINRRSLERRFRESLGITPFEEIRRLQLEHVRRMLLRTDLPLEQVAESSAFSTMSHLSTEFRRAFGVPPGQFRRNAYRSSST